MSDRHTCSWKTEGRYQEWTVERLWAASTGLPTVDVELLQLEELGHLRADPTEGGYGWLSRLPDWTHPEVQPETPRIDQADLSYPILIHPVGWVMDGQHRIAKAYRQGAQHIRAVRFTEASLPLPDIEIPATP